MSAASSAKGRAWDVVGIGTIAVLGLLGVKRRFELERSFEDKPPAGHLDLTDARCIVTGASSGIGAEVSWSLARAGAKHVTMACRNLARCEKARADLLSRCLSEPVNIGPAETEPSAPAAASRAASARAAHRRVCNEAHNALTCVHLELTSVTSVHKFADEIMSHTSSGEQLVMVNNAGVMGPGKSTNMESACDSEHVHDSQLWTNHYGHFLLFHRLLPAMGAGSIVAVIASRAHHQGSLAIQSSMDEAPFSSEAINGDPPFSRLFHAVGLEWYAQYARSKLCNVLFAAELRRRHLEGPACVVISPGLVNTGLFAGVPDPLATLIWAVQRFFQTPEEAACHILHVISVCAKADSDGALSLLPLYWHCGEPQLPSAAAEHEGLAAALWRASEAAVGLQ